MLPESLPQTISTLKPLATSEDPTLAFFSRLLNGAEHIRTVFQPVLSLMTGAVFGYEAFTRGLPGSPLETATDLFAYAEQVQSIPKLDDLCLRSAFVSAAPFLPGDISPAPQLFLNLHTKSLLAGEQTEGAFALLSELVESIGIAPDGVVIEIMERQAAQDITAFSRALMALRRRGFSIVIDDAGAGYFSLEAMANLSPDYMKIDRSLVAMIDSKPGKRALVSVISDLALQIGTRIIAEGIETQAELSTLIDLGIEYGQGYLLSRPAPGFATVAPSTTTRIVRLQERRRRMDRSRGGPPLSDLILPASPAHTLFRDELVADVQERFAPLPEDEGMPVVDRATYRPIGLIMKRALQARLAMPYGHELLARKSAEFIMDTNPLLVDETISLEGAVRRLLGRETGNLDDHVLVTKDGKYIGYISGRTLLTRMTDLQIRQARHANPLTGLPANVPIEQEVNARLHKGDPTALLYIDLDHFKPFNDRYGVARGDEAILTLARVLNDAVYTNLAETDAFSDDFIGHLGGDDFFVIVPAEQGEGIAREIVRRFDAAVDALHAPEDIKRGYFVGHDRHGTLGEFPLLTTSVAVLNVAGYESVSSYLYAAELLSELKAEVKKLPGSSYLVRDIREKSTNL